jgi:predicted O-linked N-acetylglucosamine transferase (SPINDLY family)
MDPWAVFEQAIACHKQGDLAQAESLYQKLLFAHPDHGVVNHLMGVLRAQQERYGEAMSFYEASLKTKPGDPSVLLDASNALQKLERFDEALRYLEAALTARPDYFEAINNRGIVLRKLKRPLEALACFDTALSLKPQDAAVWSNRGNALQELRRLDEALDSFDRALAIRPDHREAQLNRGVTLHMMRRFSDALAAFDQILMADPGHPRAFGEAMGSALHSCEWARMAQFAAEVPARVKDGTTEIQPLTLMNYSSDPALLLRCARDMTDALTPKAPVTLWSGETYRHDRIRVAYLSYDFRIHPVSRQLTQILETHDRTRFEIIGVSSGPDDGSETRARMIRALDQFHDVRTFSPRRIAETLRALEVDIVVDLNGHTEGTSLPALAFRPCPAQATWLGYPGTTGADFIDYLIADRIVAPLAQQEFYSEKLIHLPDSFFPTDTTHSIGIAPNRAEAGLPDDAFIFCCFNNNWKITAPVFDIWMRLLRDVPRSALWLKDYGDSAAGVLRREASARGIAPERLVFARNAPLEEHLARHQLADLFLDTLPYGAHATAADALWAGLPVLTCLGGIFPSRVAASLLQATGLAELVTETAEQYEATALGLARDPARLRTLKERLAKDRATIALFDTARFTRNLETAFVAMLKEKIG